jgi:hypothetical protein
LEERGQRDIGANCRQEFGDSIGDVSARRNIAAEGGQGALITAKVSLKIDHQKCCTMGFDSGQCVFFPIVWGLLG